MDVREKFILVTGASSGIGEATVKRLDSLGSRIIMTARNQEKMDQLSKELNQESLVIPFDFEEEDDVKEIFLQCNKKGIKLDGMVHCAGIGGFCPIKVNDRELTERLMKINYYIFLSLCHYFSKKKFSNENSSIVTMSSISVKSMEKATIPYAAAKTAVETVVRIASKELLPQKIRVNAVQPAYVKTPMVGEIEREEDFLQRQPLGIIEPEAVAELIAFLLSDDAKYITGAMIPMSAGYDYGL